MEEEEEEGRKIIDTKTIQPPPPHVPGSVTVPPPMCPAHQTASPELHQGSPSLGSRDEPPGRVPDHAFWRGCVSSGCHPVRHSGESRPVPLHPCSC